MMENLMENHPDKVGKYLMRHIENSRQQTLDKYRANLGLRENARQKLKALEYRFDGLITLSATGVAPIRAEIENTQYPTGDLSMSCPASLLGAPSYNIPSLAPKGLPLGVQLLGQHHWDERLLGYARWVRQLLAETAQ